MKLNANQIYISLNFNRFFVHFNRIGVNFQHLVNECLKYCSEC